LLCLYLANDECQADIPVPRDISSIGLFFFDYLALDCELNGGKSQYILKAGLKGTGAIAMSVSVML
jgi:hypothetical protein